MIRLPTIHDAKNLAKLGVSVLEPSDMKDINENDLAKNLEKMIESESHVMIISEKNGEIVAACSGFITNPFWKSTDNLGMITLWWSKSPFDGVGVFKRIVAYFEKVGATKIIAGAKTERAEKLMPKLGFNKLETNFIRYSHER